MAQYSATYIQQRDEFNVGDDVDLSFIVRDESGDLVTDFSAITIKAEITDGASETKLENAVGDGSVTEISVSGSVITVHVPNADTDDYSEGTFHVELQIEVASKIYTVYSDTIEFLSEEIDW